MAIVAPVILANGTIVSYSDETTSPFSYVELGKVRSSTLPGAERPRVDISHLRSDEAPPAGTAGREYVAGMRDFAATADLEFLLDFASATQYAAMLVFHGTGQVLRWRFTYPVGTVTTAKDEVFGYVANLTRELGIDQPIVVRMGIQLTGSYAFTPAT